MDICIGLLKEYVGISSWIFVSNSKDKKHTFCDKLLSNGVVVFEKFIVNKSEQSLFHSKVTKPFFNRKQRSSCHHIVIVAVKSVTYYSGN